MTNNKIVLLLHYLAHGLLCISYSCIYVIITIFLETTYCESIDDIHYLPFLTLSGDGVLALPPDDDVSCPITLPQPLPLGVGILVTMYTTVYVS